MEYIAQGFYDEVPYINQTQLKEFYNQNLQDYGIEKNITFAHIFFDANNKNEKLLSQSKALLKQLNQQQEPFEAAGFYGDRFLYNRNYVESTATEIQNHFGKLFEHSLFSLDISNQWQGPIQSNYGYHLVLIRAKSESRLPELSEVASVVLADAKRKQNYQLKRKAIAVLLNKYSIKSVP